VLFRSLGNPHRALPPVFHVAGTNGKGSTCAFLRAALEADGKSVHVFTSPHLVRFNERIRLNGVLIDDDALASYLERVLDIAEGVGASFFEVTTAAAFLAFAERPADACIVEVGLGGRLDATNIIPSPVACGIAQLGIDHQAFLGDTLAQIAAEKAAIAKPGVPLLSQRTEPALGDVIGSTATAQGGVWMPMGGLWDAAVYRERLHYRDEQGRLDTPLPRLPGPHQPINLALAIAMIRHQSAVSVGEAAIKAAPLWAQWPARLQRLEAGPLTAILRPSATIWLDGGHNEGAGAMLGSFLKGRDSGSPPVHLIVGMLENKDPDAFLGPMEGRIAHIHALPVPGHADHPPARFEQVASRWGIAFSAHDDVSQALSAIAAAGAAPDVLIAGSLYLAGNVLRRNENIPD
jgi:dihydrofolate synthase/folylpolyglutamate synthase